MFRLLKFLKQKYFAREKRLRTTKHASTVSIEDTLQTFINILFIT